MPLKDEEVKELQDLGLTAEDIAQLHALQDKLQLLGQKRPGLLPSVPAEVAAKLAVPISRHCVPGNAVAAEDRGEHVAHLVVVTTEAGHTICAACGLAQ